MIEVVKNQLDFGLITNHREVIDFWQQEIGLHVDHVLPVRRGHDPNRSAPVRSSARSVPWALSRCARTHRSRSRSLRCGDSVILLVEESDAPTGIDRPGLGWTYLTVQVRDCDAEIDSVSAARIKSRPVTMGDVARIAMVSDPDGNLLEISQRATLTGPLPQ